MKYKQYFHFITQFIKNDEYVQCDSCGLVRHYSNLAKNLCCKYMDCLGLDMCFGYLEGEKGRFLCPFGCYDVIYSHCAQFYVHMYSNHLFNWPNSG